MGIQGTNQPNDPRLDRRVNKMGMHIPNPMEERKMGAMDPRIP